MNVPNTLTVARIVLTPIVLAVPGEHIDQFRHLTFGNDLTEQHRATREAAIRRLLLEAVPA